MKRLMVRQVRALLKKLPRPHARYGISNATFEVYRAKELATRSWAAPVLKELVLAARASYLRYGRRPLLDPYDRKAAIYLVRARYGSEPLIEEWLCIRLVPGDGQPLGAGELEIFSYEGKPMDHWVRQSLSCDREDDFWKHILSSSRMCGIHPYTREPQARELSRLGTKHRYTALCFALIHAQFTVDYPPAAHPYAYVTAIIRSDFAEKGLKIFNGSEVLGPAFTPAHEFLGVSGDNTVTLEESVAFPYEFPSYWLNLSQLRVLLGVLIRQERLSRESVKHYVGNPETRMGIRKLGALLTVRGRIRHCGMTGEELRGMVKKLVPVEPELKITRAEVWNKSIFAMLEAAGLDIRRGE